MIGWKTGCLAAGALALFLAQDPERPPPAERPTPPADAGPLPPVDEPYVSPVLRHDLLQQFEPPHPIQGFYELRERVVGGHNSPAPVRGYLVVGRRHLSLHLQTETDRPEQPLLRAGFRRYRIVGDQLHMTTLLGHFNDADGDMVVEADGLTFTRRFALIGGSLRIYQDSASYLEFVRLE